MTEADERLDDEVEGSIAAVLEVIVTRQSFSRKCIWWSPIARV